MAPETWSRRRLLGTLGAVAGGGLAGCSLETSSAGSAGDATGTPTSEGGGQFASYSPPERGVDGDTPDAGSVYTSVYREVAPSVAAVRVDAARGTAQGTAWVYDRDFLVTNQHVVANASSLSVWFDGVGWLDAETVATDVYSDLAVVRVPNKPDDVDRVPLVATEPPVGTKVAAIGNPFGLSGSLSAGIVSGQNRTLPAANGFTIPDAVQTTAAVNPGNSGGPLVDLDGGVVGVINSGGGENIGFAISAAMVHRVVPALIRTGSYEHTYLGVRIAPVTPPLIAANDLSINYGVYVDDVVTDGPSEGVLQGSTGTTVVDGQRVPVGGDVIYRMGGEAIPTTRALSTHLALEARPGDTVDAGLVRDGRRETVELTLGARPEPV